MSRIGKKTISIPEKTTVTHNGMKLVVAGPRGTLERIFTPDVEITIDQKEITLAPKGDSKDVLSKWGTYASHIENMIEGVNTPYTKKLSIEGIGYKAEVKGKELVMNLGFSHQIKKSIPDTLTVVVEKNNITVTGINKDEVGQYAAVTRSYRKPEPYKGKGIRYEGEVVKIKEGKKSA